MENITAIPVPVTLPKKLIIHALSEAPRDSGKFNLCTQTGKALLSFIHNIILFLTLIK